MTSLNLLSAQIQARAWSSLRVLEPSIAQIQDLIRASASKDLLCRLVGARENDKTAVAIKLIMLVVLKTIVVVIIWGFWGLRRGCFHHQHQYEPTAAWYNTYHQQHATAGVYLATSTAPQRAVHIRPRLIGLRGWILFGEGQPS